ncbi:Uncharacterized protein Fot_21949 [Forsythia ovata]|uniref:Non-reducing end beta-L-arabinofuranosidase-like GH127 catalytic domain-containing protein n=1 Tax=Forsythia ovata TaxID=205694 RepID=A0ABD1UWB8_9LAMI
MDLFCLNHWPSHGLIYVPDALFLRVDNKLAEVNTRKGSKRRWGNRHYMSASAQMWASTHNDSLKQKMTAVVYALSSCQENMGTGYLSAFLSELFDQFEAIKPVLAPYYTIHKTVIGWKTRRMLKGNFKKQEDFLPRMTTKNSESIGKGCGGNSRNFVQN